MLAYKKSFEVVIYLVVIYFVAKMMRKSLPDARRPLVESRQLEFGSGWSWDPWKSSADDQQYITIPDFVKLEYNTAAMLSGEQLELDDDGIYMSTSAAETYVRNRVDISYIFRVARGQTFYAMGSNGPSLTLVWEKMLDSLEQLLVMPSVSDDLSIGELKQKFLVEFATLVRLLYLDVFSELKSSFKEALHKLRPMYGDGSGQSPDGEWTTWRSGNFAYLPASVENESRYDGYDMRTIHQSISDAITEWNGGRFEANEIQPYVMFLYIHLTGLNYLMGRVDKTNWRKTYSRTIFDS